uniref:Uncharacterized protein n=1 Tax=Anguilla anguilla TaxID=7936 RepID=A0A0E9XT13_ANGAN
MNTVRLNFVLCLQIQASIWLIVKGEVKELNLGRQNTSSSFVTKK